MSHAAAHKARDRRCIVTGDNPPEDELIRFALAPDGTVVPDLAAKLPGRGGWVRAKREIVDQAVKRNAFSRAFKTQVKPPADLSDQVEAALFQRCLDLLGLGRKAGAVVSGFDSVETAIRAAKPLGLIEAVDGSPSQRGKLKKLAFGLYGEEPPLAACFTAADLGMALGRDRVIHACWLQERMARRWAAEIGRLSGFRTILPDPG